MLSFSPFLALVEAFVAGVDSCLVGEVQVVDAGVAVGETTADSAVDDGGAFSSSGEGV